MKVCIFGDKKILISIEKYLFLSPLDSHIDTAKHA